MVEKPEREKPNLDQTVFFLNEEEWKEFNEILEKPFVENKALENLLKMEFPWDT